MQELNFLINQSTVSVAEVEWWLLKYSDYVKEINNNCNCCSKTDELPCVCKRTENEKTTLEVFYNLDELTQYHRIEKYANEQIIEFKQLNKNPKEVKKWLIKNEKIASQDLACFLIDYLDYSENEKDNINLLAYRNENYKIEVFVDRKDFENLIEFKELFDELYYAKKLYPEGLKRIDKEMKTTANKENRA
ncbi:hypothetical protein [Algibacter mikhailovii]|uniref:Uncharacterized protein n=1 Tax=Algibacter mikhailovii TaxID=425498 RepID=A0A918RC97_9FLAO|nr:hypothetical protein [Algibacter mikhailovii]GGZ92187.1 hypothetical protein GCM10007028_33330 [Algibacter mikhailovii]